MSVKILDSFTDPFVLTGILTWDALTSVANVFRFNRPAGKLIPAGKPGHGGEWPEYQAPKEGYSRSSCPALNTMANHGIIPRDGKNVKFSDVYDAIYWTYNLSPSFCYFLCWYTARMLKKSVWKDTFDLEQASLHNGVEHDASLTRVDTGLHHYQGAADKAYVEDLLSFATGKDASGKTIHTTRDLGRYLGKRRAICKATNKEYSLALGHKMISSANTAIVPCVFGHTDDVQSILGEERLPQGWEPRARKCYGLPLSTLNFTAVPIAFGIKESDWTEAAKEAAEAQEASQDDGR